MSTMVSTSSGKVIMLFQSEWMFQLYWLHYKYKKMNNIEKIILPIFNLKLDFSAAHWSQDDPPIQTFEPRTAYTATLDPPGINDQPTLMLGVWIPPGWNGNCQIGWSSISWQKMENQVTLWEMSFWNSLSPSIFEFWAFTMLHQQQCVVMSTVNICSHTL